MKTKFLGWAVSLLLLNVFSPLISQTAFEWDYYGIGFEVASDFQVQVNNKSQFTAVSSDGLLAVTLVPWSDSNVDLNDLAEATIDVADRFAHFDHAAVDGDAINLGDLEGYFIVAATNDYYSYDYILVSLLLDTQSETNIVVAIGFMEGNQDEAIEILTSVYPYDP
ncbi:MAG: hypothetical protein KDC53_24030 [Saprospiraceae bacterium]|nr:hypothetical protein [Saprospiraceae bacterium]